MAVTGISKPLVVLSVFAARDPPDVYKLAKIKELDLKVVLDIIPGREFEATRGETLQKFAAAHAAIHNHFNQDHHLNRRDILRQLPCSLNGVTSPRESLDRF